MGIRLKLLFGDTNWFKTLIALGAIHISSYERQEGHGGLPMPVYSYGPGTNARRLKAMKGMK